jgi:hypothetical protein
VWRGRRAVLLVRTAASIRGRSWTAAARARASPRDRRTEDH